MPDATAQIYDRAAESWLTKVSNLGYAAAYRHFVGEILNDRHAPTAICDVGCGPGTFTIAAISAGLIPARLVLVDPSEEMLSEAEIQFRRLGHNAVCHPATLETFETVQKFDLVLGAHVVEICQSPSTAIRDLYALLAPGGTLLLVISRPHWCQWFIWLRWRHRWFSTRQIRQFADQAGLPQFSRHRFQAGPPKRTSFGYAFQKPPERNPKPC